MKQQVGKTLFPDTLINDKGDQVDEKKPQTAKFYKKKSTRIRTGEESFSVSEWQKLMAACVDMQDEIMLMIGGSLGIRRGDTNMLKWSNIDFKNHTLSYTEKKKGGKIITVPLEPKLEQQLLKYKNSFDKTPDYIFPYTKKWGDRSLWNRLNALCDKAGVRRRKYHALRSTCVKFHQKAGWRAEDVAELIDDSVEVVLLHYATPSKSELEELAKEKGVL